MNDKNWERWGAATGYLVFVLGIAGAAFERGAPPANAPVEETLAFFAIYRTELLTQSLLFVFSAGLYLWFFGSLRSFLFRAEAKTGTLSLIAFGTGIIWAGLQMVFQSFQVALAMGSGGEIEPSLAALISDLTYALSVIAYVPMSVMLAAVAVLVFQTKAFPAWLGWLSAIAAVINLLLSLGIVADSGPFVPGGILTYVIYLLTAVWLFATTTVMFVRFGKPAKATRLAEGQI
jgi:hypothetical protein